jgi:hypothetical protein
MFLGPVKARFGSVMSGFRNSRVGLSNRGFTPRGYRCTCGKRGLYRAVLASVAPVRQPDAGAPRDCPRFSAEG